MKIHWHAVSGDVNKWKLSTSIKKYYASPNRKLGDAASR